MHQIIREDAPRPCGDDHMTEDYRLGDVNFVGLLIYCSFEFQSLSGLCNCCDCFFPV